MAERYLIKKYSSRRLYDVQAGGFLTIGDLDRLIRQGRQIKVVDSKGRDETRSVLLQILTEREEGGEPLLSVELLHDMVRLYGNVMHGPFGRYLEEGMAVMRKQHETWRAGISEVLTSGTKGIVDALIDQQLGWLKAGQEAWFGKADQAAPKASGSGAAAPAKPRRRR